jgi:4-diphosphocytidyl-2-C-methyl-D-erythritol kinase
MAPRGTAVRRVRVTAPAKLNLALAIGPRRADGFHELATLFQTISLADTLEVERRARGFTLSIRFEDAALVRRGGRHERRRASAARRRDVPATSRNLVLRAARTLAHAAGIAGGAAFRLVKRIPTRAGMGGGSADAAAALVGLARLYELRIAPADLRALGLSLGADVPFALFGGTALGRGVGEKLTRVHLRRPERVLIALPTWRVSTAAAFRAIDRRKYGLTLWRSNLRCLQILGRERVTALQAVRLGNTFEDALEKRRRDFLDLCARMRGAGVEEPRLTGSGSAVFGLLPRAIPARQIVERFAGSEELFLVRTTRAGPRVKKLS